MYPQNIPLISVIIPTYNKACFLGRALESVLSQTYSNWEILVIDNHSIDHTDDVIKGFVDPRISFFKIHNNGAIGVSRNIGIKHAQGKYIAFLDSDDWWVPKKLDIALHFLEQGADLVYHDTFVVKKIGQKCFFRVGGKHDLQKPIFNDLILNGNPIIGSSVVTRKSILLEIQGQTEDVEMEADYDTWLKIANITESFKKIPQILGYYWVGGGNTSSPDRSLMVLNAIEKKYKKNIKNLIGVEHPWWCNYLRGRNHYLLDQHVEAEEAFKKEHWYNFSISIAIKVQFMKLAIKSIRFFNKLKLLTKKYFDCLFVNQK